MSADTVGYELRDAFCPQLICCCIGGTEIQQCTGIRADAVPSKDCMTREVLLATLHMTRSDWILMQ